MSGELTGEDESDGSLDLAGGERLSLVVSDESGGLTSDSLEDVVDEGVHDAHGLLGDADLGVDLLEDSVDVDGEGLNSSGSSGSSGSGSGSFLSGSAGSGSGHFNFRNELLQNFSLPFYNQFKFTNETKAVSIDLIGYISAFEDY